MIHMIQNAKDQVADLTMAAYQKAVAAQLLPQADVQRAPVETPKDTSNGDYTTTFALSASKLLRQNLIYIAQIFLDTLELEGTYFSCAAIAGPVFLNFRLNASW